MMNRYLERLLGVARASVASDMDFDSAISSTINLLKMTNGTGNKIMIIGNGGSAGIASHVAIDLSKNAGIRAMALNDAATLTCLANDYGYENVFAKQIEYHARYGDVLIAISSSGKSPNILRAVLTAKDTLRWRAPSVVTFSGFEPDNPLRTMGDINFYVPSSEYGFVELAHQIFLPAITDVLCAEREKIKEAAE